jgi:cohesin complex subunit SCC1
LQRNDAAPKAKRPRLLQADLALELPDEDFAAPTADSALLTDPHFIPSDPELVRLQTIASDPASHFLPTLNIGGNSMIYAGPEGLTSELAGLFTFPANLLRRDRSEEDNAGPSPKRPRLAQEEPDMEEGRRGSMFPPSEAAFDFGAGDQTFDTIVPHEDFGGDLFQPDVDAPAFATPTKQPSLAPSRAESIARAIQFSDDSDHPLAMFDNRRSDAHSQSQQSQLETPTKSVTSSEATRGGYSKNTGMAMGLLRKELEAIEGEDKVVGFDKLAGGASKRAASAFFFELLVLGTKDCVKVNQERAFEDIKIRSKPRLYQDLSA